MIRRRSPVCSGTFDLKTGKRRRGFFHITHRDVNKCAQAVVLAEVAAGILVARRAIADVLDGILSDERGAMAVLVKTDWLLRPRR